MQCGVLIFEEFFPNFDRIRKRLIFVKAGYLSLVMFKKEDK